MYLVAGGERGDGVKGAAPALAVHELVLHAERLHVEAHHAVLVGA